MDGLFYARAPGVAPSWVPRLSRVPSLFRLCSIFAHLFVLLRCASVLQPHFHSTARTNSSEEDRLVTPSSQCTAHPLSVRSVVSAPSDLFSRALVPALAPRVDLRVSANALAFLLQLPIMSDWCVHTGIRTALEGDQSALALTVSAVLKNAIQQASRYALRSSRPNGLPSFASMLTCNCSLLFPPPLCVTMQDSRCVEEGNEGQAQE